MKHPILLIVFLLVISSLSCHKYPEDEANIHLRNAYKRIYGEWTVTRYEVDGIDSTASFQNNPDYYCRYTFYKRHSQYDFRKMAKFKCKTGTPLYESWHFDYKGYTHLTIGDVGMANLIRNYSGLHWTPWKILQLENNILRLELTYSNINYKVAFKKV